MGVPASPVVAATPADSDAVVDLLVGAFLADPSWSAILVDRDTRPRLLGLLWRVFCDNAIAAQSLWLNERRTAAAVWVAPGGVEMTDAEEEYVAAALRDTLGDGADHVLGALDAFDAAHPHDEPHYTLSLLGTAVEHRGHGYGLQLLADSLVVVDEAGLPAYLEASNPANVALYERYGFQRYAEFTIPNGPSVTTMWRPSRSEG